MTTPNASGGTDNLAFTGFGPGTAILAIVGLALSGVGWIMQRFARGAR